MTFCALLIDTEQEISWVGLPGFYRKTRPIAAQTGPIAFREGSPGKNCLPGAKRHVIGVASEMKKKNSAPIVLMSYIYVVKVTQFCVKTADVATLFLETLYVISLVHLRSRFRLLVEEVL